MPTLTKREVARRTRELLNSNGLHWTKGEYVIWGWNEEKRDDIQMFCSVGGIRQIVFGDGEYLPLEGYGDPEMLALYNETITDLAAIIRRRWPEVEKHWQLRNNYSVPMENEALVVEWNDAEERTWEDVNSAFSELALMKAQKAHAPQLDQDDWL